MKLNEPASFLKSSEAARYGKKSLFQRACKWMFKHILITIFVCLNLIAALWVFCTPLHFAEILAAIVVILLMLNKSWKALVVLASTIAGILLAIICGAGIYTIAHHGQIPEWVNNLLPETKSTSKTITKTTETKVESKSPEKSTAKPVVTEMSKTTTETSTTTVVTPEVKKLDVAPTAAPKEGLAGKHAELKKEHQETVAAQKEKGVAPESEETLAKRQAELIQRELKKQGAPAPGKVIEADTLPTKRNPSAPKVDTEPRSLEDAAKAGLKDTVPSAIPVQVAKEEKRPRQLLDIPSTPEPRKPLSSPSPLTARDRKDFPPRPLAPKMLEEETHFILKLNLDTQQGNLLEDNALVYGPFDIGSGGPDNQSEPGEYRVTSMEEDGYSYTFGVQMPFLMKLKSIKPGPKKTGVGFHVGDVTNPASHGCFRGRRVDVIHVFNLVKPHWLKDHDCIEVVVTGSIGQLYQKKFGDLLTYNDEGTPIDFARSADGSIAPRVIEAIVRKGDHPFEVFYEDADGNFTTDKSKWFFSIEVLRKTEAKIYVTTVEKLVHKPFEVHEAGAREMFQRQQEKRAAQARHKNKS